MEFLTWGPHESWRFRSRDTQQTVAEPVHVPEAQHALVGARIPYLPTSENLDAAAHPEYLSREIFRRFSVLTETIAALDPAVTVALYLRNQPARSRRHPRIDLYLLVKATHAQADQAQRDAAAAWDVIEHAFPREHPYGYPLTPLAARTLKILCKELTPGRIAHVTEIAKYWDLGRRQGAEAFAHPYRSTATPKALLAVFSALSASPDQLTLIFSWRPAALLDLIDADRVLQSFGTGPGDPTIPGPTTAMGGALPGATLEPLDSLTERLIPSPVAREDERLRAAFGAHCVDRLLRNQNRLLEMRVRLTSRADALPTGVIGALRVALAVDRISGGDLADYGSPPEAVTVTADRPDFTRRLEDLRTLEHRPAAGDPRGAWRTLVSPEEAAGMWCLPMPAEFGHVPGMVVGAQPFALPIEPIEGPAQNRPGVGVGPILDRGIETEHTLEIPLARLDQHILIAGRTGSGKTNTSLTLLSGLWRHGVRFLVLDPLNKHDYRILLGDPTVPDADASAGPLSDALRVFTLGDTTSPFSFNPFRIPPGVTVAQHISQLLRCFLTAFAVSDPVPAIYRAALRETYVRKGWRLEDRAGSTHEAPTFSQFFLALERVVAQRSADYAADVRGNIRQMALIRIGSLLEDNAAILNVSDKDARDPFPDIVTAPTVLELGHLGSDEDKALLMAFLLTSLVPHIQYRQPRTGPHVLLIEEAHRLMRRGGRGPQERGDPAQQTRSDFSNLLAEVRGFGQGIIVADQSPAELVPAVFSNTATHIMHAVRDPESFAMFQEAFVLSPAQANFARRLARGHAIAETALGTPVHIHPANGMDALKERLRGQVAPNGIPLIDAADERGVVSNSALEHLMRTRAVALPVTIGVPDYNKLLATAPKISDPPRQILPAQAPLPYCAGCLPLWRTGECRHRTQVQDYRKSASGANLVNEHHRRLIQLAPGAPWDWMAANGRAIAAQLTEDPAEYHDALFCYLVHLTNLVARHDNGEVRKSVARYFQVLRDYHRRVNLNAQEASHEH